MNSIHSVLLLHIAAQPLGWGSGQGATRTQSQQQISEPTTRLQDLPAIYIYNELNGSTMVEKRLTSYCYYSQQRLEPPPRVESAKPPRSYMRWISSRYPLRDLRGRAGVSSTTSPMLSFRFGSHMGSWFTLGRRSSFMGIL